MIVGVWIIKVYEDSIVNDCVCVMWIIKVYEDLIVNYSETVIGSLS